MFSCHSSTTSQHQDKLNENVWPGAETSVPNSERFCFLTPKILTKGLNSTHDLISFEEDFMRELAKNTIVAQILLLSFLVCKS